MANERRGMEGASIDWSYATSQAFLPPRSPLFPAGSQPYNPGSNSYFSNWTKLSHPSTNRRHQRTPSTSFLPQTPAWVDDLLNDTPDVPPSRTNHRRSSSDSLAFLDTPLQHARIQDIPEEDSDQTGMDPGLSRGSRALDKLDEEPILSSFAESVLRQKHFNGSVHSANGSPYADRRVPLETSSAPSDQDSGNASSIDDKKAQSMGQCRNENEVQSGLKSEHTLLPAGGKEEAQNSTDSSLDPKRAKRILANRQSAQRSRVRKLQYIAELERTVNVLQEEVSALSPQVTYLDRHRILLNVDNSAMKQRIAALAQEKLFKDAHNEALKSELHRLRQLCQQQQQPKQGQPSMALQQYDVSMSSHLEFKDNDGTSDMSTQYMEQMYKGNEADMLKSHPILRSPHVKPIGPSNCSNAGDKGKDLNLQSMAGIAQIQADY